VSSVAHIEGGVEVLKMAPVGDKPFGPSGGNEDSTFSRWTPSGGLSLTMANPALFGGFNPGQKFYLDFTAAAKWARNQTKGL
jgi:hypothetical protein